MKHFVLIELRTANASQNVSYKKPYFTLDEINVVNIGRCAALILVKFLFLWT